MRRRLHRCPAFWLVLAVSGTAQADGGDPVELFDPVTPYRPTVSNPAQLPAPGQLELEVGGLRSRSTESRRSSIPYLLKLAFDPQWGVLVGGDAHIWQRDDDGRAQGAGSTALTLKRAWMVDAATALGAELTARVPTGSERVGAGGKADYTVNTIASRDFGPVHLDANFNATRLGSPDAGSSRALFGASASLAVPISERWGATGEFSATHQGGSGGNGAQLLAALTWSPNKRLTFDAGIARAWRPAPGTTQLFAGVVLPLAKLR